MALSELRPPGGGGPTPGGPFIPLAGTDVGAPVTGAIELVDPTAGFLWKQPGDTGYRTVLDAVGIGWGDGDGGLLGGIHRAGSLVAVAYADSAGGLLVIDVGNPNTGRLVLGYGIGIVLADSAPLTPNGANTAPRGSLAMVNGLPWWKENGTGDTGWVPHRLPALDTPPAVANAMDDEFTGSSLDAKWSYWGTLATQTPTVAGEHLALSTPHTTNDPSIQAITQPLPAAEACSFGWRLDSTGYYSGGVGDSRGGVILTEGDENDAAYLLSMGAHVGVSTDEWAGLEKVADSSGAVFAGPYVQTTGYWRWGRVDIAANGFDCEFYRSHDGYEWTSWFTRSLDWPATGIGFFGQCWSQVANANARTLVLADWFRRLS